MQKIITVDFTNRVGEMPVGFYGKLSPNPNNGKFNLELSNIPTGSWKLEVLNAIGQQVLSKLEDVQYSTTNIPVKLENNIASGLYILTMSNEKGQSFTKKFIVN
jgi:hypothetical protein